MNILTLLTAATTTGKLTNNNHNKQEMEMDLHKFDSKVYYSPLNLSTKTSETINDHFQELSSAEPNINSMLMSPLLMENNSLTLNDLGESLSPTISASLLLPVDTESTNAKNNVQDIVSTIDDTINGQHETTLMTLDENLINLTNHTNNNCSEYYIHSSIQQLLTVPNDPSNTGFTALSSQASSTNLTLSNYSSLSNSIINYDMNLTSPYCPTAWDGVSCWRQTKAGETAIIPCFSYLFGIPYDTSQNATRMCLRNGTWALVADYGHCKTIQETIPSEQSNQATPIQTITNIYYFGYILSLLGLSVALFIFRYFKDLRCIRNIIHTNLMITYLLIAICWIVTDQLHKHLSSTSEKASCITVILLTYLMGTNFSWMFVEGLYLYILVVKTFSIEIVKITNYMIIGWISPAIVILCWSLIKLRFTVYDQSKLTCPYQAQDEFDYIYKVPILLVLVVNVFFLGKIMWVLIIKLRASNSIESKQYRKAAKALLVLIPLLGVGYMLVLVTPSQQTAKIVFQYLQAILVSTQGFTVAVLYCFCNGEVRKSLKHHFQRFRLQHNITGNGRAEMGRFTTSNISTKPHKNRVGFVNMGAGGNMKSRDSCISYTTTTSISPVSITTTTVTANNNNGNDEHQGLPEELNSQSSISANINTNKNGYHSIPTTSDDDINDEYSYEQRQIIEMHQL